MPGRVTERAVLPQYALRAAAFLLLLLAAGGSGDAKKADKGGTRVDARLDHQAWLGDGRNKATIWFLDGDAHITCDDGRAYSVVARNRIHMFEGCGSIHVVMPDGYLAGRDEVAAIAAHEAFHALVQLSARSFMRLDTVESIPLDMETLSTGNTTRFFKAIADALSGAEEDSLSCGNLGSLFLSLSPDEQRYVVWGSYIEWPAEFYMSTSLGFDDAKYLQFRMGYSHWTEVDWKYVAGHFAMKRIDIALGRGGWQAAYSNGQAPLDALWRSLGCPGNLLPRSPLVTFTPGAFHSLETLSPPRQMTSPR